jgi:hypothetical protein
MDWFSQLRQALGAYYDAQPADIVGYLRGSASPQVWRSMASGPAPRHQKLILGNRPPSTEDWAIAGVAQRDTVQTIRLPTLTGLIVLYAGFPSRPWGEIHEATPDAQTLGFPAS